MVRQEPPTPLALLRGEMDLTQLALARAAGVSVDTIKRAEDGKHPSLRLQFRIAKALDVPRVILFPEEAA